MYKDDNAILIERICREHGKQNLGRSSSLYFDKDIDAAREADVKISPSTESARRLFVPR